MQYDILSILTPISLAFFKPWRVILRWNNLVFKTISIKTFHVWFFFNREITQCMVRKTWATEMTDQQWHTMQWVVQWGMTQMSFLIAQWLQADQRSLPGDLGGHPQKRSHPWSVKCLGRQHILCLLTFSMQILSLCFLDTWHMTAATLKSKLFTIEVMHLKSTTNLHRALMCRLNRKCRNCGVSAVKLWCSRLGFHIHPCAEWVLNAGQYTI